MSGRRLRAILQKELRHIVRDARSLILALALPLLFLLLFGYALSLDVDRIPTVIYDADQSPESRDLIQRFAASRYFHIEGLASDYHEIEQSIDTNRALVGIAILRDYSRRLDSGQEADVQVVLDGSDSNTASIALAYADTVLRDYSFELRSTGQNHKAGIQLPNPIDAQLRVWYNSSLESKNFIVPGLIAVILMIISSMLTSLTIAREWEMGTMEQLQSTPVRPAELVLGKMLAYFVVGTADTIIAVVVGIFLFDVPMRGSFWLLAASSAVFLVGALFWGIFISAVSRSQALAFQLGLLTSFLPAMQLSGFIYAVENMPAAVQVITYIVPARYFVKLAKEIFLKGVGLELVWRELLFLGIFGFAIFLLTARKMTQKMA
ncbi:MAG TPA: ABC transporter permease [Bryobacteraceae bacterium]|nr:ABC transporter permease [Bryobacteraceae bacterium]